MAEEKKPAAAEGPAKVGRRDFMKVSGLTAAAVGAAGVLGAGFANGKDPATALGWQQQYTPDEFDRTPFEVDEVPYNVWKTPIDKPHYNNVPQDRRSRINGTENGVQIDIHNWDTIPPDLQEWYTTNPEKYQADLTYLDEVLPTQRAYMAEHGDRYALSSAYLNSWLPPVKPAIDITEKPEVYDWKGVKDPPYEIKDPADMSVLIKQIAKLFGSPIVRIAKLQDQWLYDKAPLGLRGYEMAEPIVRPSWWEYAICICAPLNWDEVKASPSFSSSMQGYGIHSVIAVRLCNFIKSLGYPARHHTGGSRYELIVKPILVDAGFGEQGRNDLIITPELGCNFRPAVITTSLPLVPDKPIDIGVRKFCETCKICADSCPAAAISHDPPTNKPCGVDGWPIDYEACNSQWRNGGGGCRVCMGICPWSKRSDWVHKAARDVVMRDKSGLAAKGLVWMERNFFGNVPPEQFNAPEYGSLNPPPWYFDSERFLKNLKGV